MPSLQDLQRGFFAAMFTRGDPTLGGAIAVDDLGAAQRVSIYRNNVHASLHGALTALYPVLERLVGARYFRQAANAFIHRHLPQSANLHDFGREFPRFIATLAEMEPHPYIRNVGLIEWARHQASHAADDVVFPLERLADIDPADHGKLRFVLARSATLGDSGFPVVSIWEANHDESTQADSIDLDAGAEPWIVWRREGVVLVRRLSAGEHVLLRNFAQHQPFATAIEAASRAESALNIAECLHAHLNSGVVVDFNL